MKWSILITLAVACLSFRPLPQPDLLEQPVTLDYQEASLRQILHDISTEYQIKFAYLNNEMPEERTFSIQVQNQALRLVLEKLLADTGLAYRLMNGQVVLKKKAEPSSASPPSREESKDEVIHKSPPKDTTAAVSKARPPTQATPATNNAGLQALSVSTPMPRVVKPNSLPEEPEPLPPPTIPTLAPVAVNTATTSSTTVITKRFSRKERKRKKNSAESKQPNEFGQKVSEHVRRAIDKLLPGPPPDSSDYIRRFFHIGLIYPLSTNGLQAGRTVNQVSLHLLAGYAAGLDGAEFSAFGNIENDFVEGAQFAGFFNLVRRRVNGLQAAGFANVSGGDGQGAQLAGFVNVGAGTTNGLQAAGFVNITTESVRGAQLSGFVNYARSIRGLQATGYVNVASGDVRGVQLASFVNYARYVKGVQIGLLNIADSIDGVPIGLVSFVRKNGYRHSEVWYSEALQSNLAIKMGVSKFYNMLMLGAQFADTNFRWGVGYGVGSLFPITSTTSVNLDIFAMQIHENNQGFFNAYALNLLNTVRLSLNLQLAKHLTLWAAPTFNVMVSQYRQPDSQVIGSTITPSWTTFNRTFNNRTNATMWPGFQVGFRF